MADFLDRLVAREFGTANYVMPRAGALFEDHQLLELSEYGIEGETQFIPEAVMDGRRGPRLENHEGEDTDRRANPVPRDRAPEAPVPSIAIGGPAVGSHPIDPSQADKIEESRDASATLHPPIVARQVGELDDSAELTTPRSAAKGQAASRQAANRTMPLPTVVVPDVATTSDAIGGRNGSPASRELGSGRVERAREHAISRFAPHSPTSAINDTELEQRQQPASRGAALSPFKQNAARAMLRMPSPMVHETGKTRRSDIEISIGRVEVRASRGHSQTARQGNAQKPLGLADYLRQRHEARRR